MMLELRGIIKRFGSVLANHDVDIVVAPGTIHAIVGENGAGKSTAMRIAYGFYTADAGVVLIDGEVRSINTPRDAIALGIGMVHQHFMLVESMTVAENIVLGAEPGSAAALDLAAAERDIAALSAAFHLAVEPRALVERLSVGQQQRVELLKALYRRARLLILDEPTAVLTPLEVEDLFTILRGMRAQGKTIVIITHKLSEVLAISDRVTVMRDGRVVANLGTPATNAAELARLMVGRDVLLRVDKRPATPAGPVLTVRSLSVAAADGTPRVNNLSLELRGGEILGIAGVEGNGQSELIEALAGLIPASRVAGGVEFNGRDLTPLDARHRHRLGIAHIPEDRQRRGLLLDSSLLENAILGVHDRPPAVNHAGSVLLNWAAIRRRTEQILRDFDVRPPQPDLAAAALSGGNQQKLIVGREFGLPPALLLVAQPTRGVDIGAIEFIHRQLVALRDAGCAILLVSAELEEIMALADRVIVMHGGAIAGEADPRTTTTQAIGLMMADGR